MRVTWLLFAFAIAASGCRKSADDEQVDWLNTLIKANMRMVDRIAMPGVENFLVSDTDVRNALNTTAPEQDVQSSKVAIRTEVNSIREGYLVHAAAENPLLGETTADDVASLVSPNVFTIDMAMEPSFPGNGRKLTDDVYDVFLRLVFDRELSDAITNPQTFKPEFPFFDHIPDPSVAAW